MDLAKLFMLAIGGGIGTVCRYSVNSLSLRMFGDGFPWGTLAVNLVGSFLVGMAFAVGMERNLLSPGARLFLMTGFLGGLTTFSALALETVHLGRENMPLAALGMILAHTLGGLAMVIAGIWVGRSF